MAGNKNWIKRFIKVMLVVSAVFFAALSSYGVNGSDRDAQVAEISAVSISENQVPMVEAPSSVGPSVKSMSSNGVSLYISKMSKTVTLKQHGIEIGTYPASLGENSGSGDKQIEGDRKTPSGEFYVCTMNDKSAYYLGIGLSYPDIPDAERGYSAGIITQEERDSIISAIKAGEKPPWNTALGGAIELHGERYPGGVTAGCIALDNDIMDILWKYCQIGVPVTIGP